MYISEANIQDTRSCTKRSFAMLVLKKMKGSAHVAKTVNCTEDVIIISNGTVDNGKLVALGDGGKFHRSVIPVIDDLQSQITEEVSTRTEADEQLQVNLDAEALARTNTDVKLQSNIEEEANARIAADSDLQDKIVAEVIARTNGDNQLQVNIDVEVAARTAADQILKDQISKEVADRTEANNTLQATIDTEANSRASADKELQEQLTKEVEARTDSDTALKSSIDVEVAARTDADNKLQSSIDAEVDARTKADQGLQDQVTAEITARSNADETESNTRSSADKNLQEQIDVLEGKNAFSNVVVNGTTIQADGQTDTLELKAGTNIQLTADAENDAVTIAVTGQVTSADTASVCTGNAATATKLQTTRTISLTGDATGSVAFDGSEDASITVDVTTADTASECTGNAATATKLKTARTINGVAFDGSADITIVSTASTNTVAMLSGTVLNGGTIPLPAGYIESQCVWMVSIQRIYYSGDVNGDDSTYCYTTGRVVTVYSSEQRADTVANYIIIGVK